MQSYLKSLLEQRQQQALYRLRHIHRTPQSPLLQIAGQTYLAFCSNDYLGLAHDPQVKLALQQATEIYGVGSGASHLISGHTVAHQQLEQDLARYTQRERALLFSTGYMANLGVISALLTRHDAVFLDKFCHASLIDAALLSRAQLHRYIHNDMQNLEYVLSHSSALHKLIVTDGVFSMEGDMADLLTIVQLAKKYDAWVMVDDAHGLGVMGQTGRGSLEFFHLTQKEIPILMGTLGKAFGVFGAFVAGSEMLIETLIQFARSYIYTTALPPALAVATSTSLAIAQVEQARRTYLHELIAYFRQCALQQQIALLPSFTPIQIILLGDAEKAIAVSHALYQQKILVTAIRPPTVPAGKARLRITLSASHQKAQIDRLVDVLARSLPSV
jgi:8-amino-7-oxononanoate synthase